MTARKFRVRSLYLEPLEDRCTPTASLSPEGQYFLELINRGRADPAAEAARFGIDLNEGLAAGTISTAATQPLAPNASLQTAVEEHLAYLASTGQFSHSGADGSQPWDRATAAGYPSTFVGENLAYQTGSMSPAVLDDLYRALFVDTGVDGRGHRLNLLNGQYGEIGSGVTTGSTPSGPGVLAGQDFGHVDGRTVLTGVAYVDSVVADQFYTVGEGLGGVTVSAVGGGGNFSATTTASGGYTLVLPAGGYSVAFTTATGQPLGQYAVTVGSANVKLDHSGAASPPVSPPTDGQLLGGWRIAAPFARGSMAVDWSTRRLWVSGHEQVQNVLYEYVLPDMGTTEDPSAWPALTPSRIIPNFWGQGDGSIYANGLAFWQGEVWVAPRKYYDTAPPGDITLYSESGRTYTVDLPRQQFSGFVKRFGQDPLLGGGGTESGQGAARGPTLATLDGQTVYLSHTYAADWESREIRPPDYYPVNHVDEWYALEPRDTDGDGVMEGRWASDKVYGGGLWLPQGVAYWPWMGTGEIDYAVQNQTLSATAATYQYVYDTTTWRPTFSATPFGPITGQDFGPNGEIMLVEGNAWKSDYYPVDPVIRMYHSLPAALPPTTPLPPIPPVVPPTGSVTGTVPPGVTHVIAVGSDVGGPGIARLVDPATGTPYLTYTDPAFGSVGGVRVVAADFTGDGVPDLAVGTGPGRVTHVKVFSGKTGALVYETTPFEASFTGGVFVAAGDLTGDGKAELIITPDEGGGPRVRVLDGGTFATVADFYGIDDPNFRGGARASAGDVNNDGRDDLVVAAGFGGGPRLAVFDGHSVGNGQPGPKLAADFFVFESTVRNGAYISVADVDGDGFGDLVSGGGPGGGPRVRTISGRDLVTTGTVADLTNYFAGDADARSGVRVVARDLTGDGRAELIAGPGGTAGVNILNPVTNESFDLSWPDCIGGVYVG